MSDQTVRIAEFLKARLVLLVGSAFIMTTGMLGLLDLLFTASVDAVPVYVHAVVGAAVFPVSAFVLEYRGFDVVDAVHVGVGAALLVSLVLLLITEGAGRIANDPFELGVSTVFYVVTASLVASTLVVVWVGRNHMDGASEEKERNRRRGRERGTRRRD